MSETIQYIPTEREDHFQCPYCDKVAKRSTLHYHVKKEHLKKFEFTCSICSDNGKTMNFMQKIAYEKHMIAIHPEIATIEKNPFVGVSYKCPSCDFENIAKGNVKTHYARNHCKDWIPSFTKGSPCKGCDKVFNSPTAYLYHAITCIKPIPEHHAKIISLIK